jgi:hypothetical protein
MSETIQIWSISDNSKIFCADKILVELKYLGTTVRNQTHSFEEDKSNLHSWAAP